MIKGEDKVEAGVKDKEQRRLQQTGVFVAHPNQYGLKSGTTSSETAWDEFVLDR